MAVVVLSSCAKKHNVEDDYEARPIDKDKAVEITEYTGSKWAIQIPSRIQNLPVTTIREGAFRGKNLVSVTIPNNITSIGRYAFADNQLTSITIGAGVNFLPNIGSSDAFDRSFLRTYSQYNRRTGTYRRSSPTSTSWTYSPQ